jgi:hypothetical protein
MNPRADGGTATVGEIYNQTYSYKETFAFGQSRLDWIAPLLRRASSPQHILGIKSGLSEIFLPASSARVGQVLACGRVRGCPGNSDAPPHLAGSLLLKLATKPLKYEWRGSIVTQH